MLVSCKVDEKTDPPLEKLELEPVQGRSTRSTATRLYLWEDRWIWIDAREMSRAQWLWSYQFEGRTRGYGRG